MFKLEYVHVDCETALTKVFPTREALLLFLENMDVTISEAFHLLENNFVITDKPEVIINLWLIDQEEFEEEFWS